MRDEQKSFVRVSIFGHEYTVKAPADPEYIKEIAEYVSNRMKEVEQGLSTDQTISRIAILTAMNIADELKRKQGLQGAMQILRTVTKSSQLKDKLGYLLSPDLKGYIDEFDDNPRVIKALLKKIYQFLTK